MQHINELIEKAHTAITKLGDALIKEFEKTNGVNLDVLKAEAAEWDKVKNINLDELKAKAEKYDSLKKLIG